MENQNALVIVLGNSSTPTKLEGGLTSLVNASLKEGSKSCLVVIKIKVGMGASAICFRSLAQTPPEGEIALKV